MMSLRNTCPVPAASKRLRLTNSQNIGFDAASLFIRLIKTLTISVMCIFMGACASPRDRFPGFIEQVSGKTSIDVVIDAVFFSDIEGSALGFNSSRNAEALEEIKTSVTKSLAERGFSVEFLDVMNGVFYEKMPEVNYFYSSNWKSTGEDYVGPNVDVSESPWSSPDMTSFLRAVVKEAQNISNDGISPIEGSDNSQTSSKPASSGHHSAQRRSLVASPKAMSTLSSDIYLYVQVEGKIQSLQKFLTQSVLAGAVTGILTGGTVIVMAEGSPIAVDIVAIDADNAGIAWHKRHVFQGYKSIGLGINSAFRDFPMSSGRYLPGEEELLRRKLQGRE